MSMRIVICDNVDAWVQAVADRFQEELSQKPDLITILSTGSTPEPVYDELVKRYQEGKLSLQDMRAYNLDEYVGINPDDPNSYRYYMEHRLFSKVDIAAENCHIPSGSAADPEEECAKYEALLQGEGYADFALLGVGHNGHIGFNEPGTSFDSKTHVVELTQSTIDANKQYFSSEEEMPKKALTMGLSTIVQSKRILVVARGTGKAEIIKQITAGAVSEEVPGTILQRHADVTVMVDQEAGALL